MISGAQTLPPGLPVSVLEPLAPDEQDVFRLAFGSALAEGGTPGEAIARSWRAIGILRAVRVVEKAFDPAQPRVPVGDPKGGQWSSDGGAGGNDKSLGAQLKDLRPKLAEAAQKEVDEWEQDEEGIDEELGAGGACDRVCGAMSGVITAHVSGDLEFVDDIDPGGDHAWLVVHDGKKAYGVDIPPGVYETGSGYRWQKIPGAKIKADDVEVWSIPIGDVVDKTYDPNQPREPAGSPEGGQWSGGGGGEVNLEGAPVDGRGWSKEHLFHGTGLEIRPSGRPTRLASSHPLYLTASRSEASGFAEGRHLGGAGDDPRTYELQFKPGKTLNIDDQIDSALEASGDIDEAISGAISVARRSKIRYLTFTHPGFEGKDFKAIVSLYPKDDLRVWDWERVKKNEGATEKTFNPDQPRRPKGDPAGGQWAGAGGGSGGSEARTGKLTPTERSYIDNYSGDAFLTLNQELRAGGTGGKAAAAINSAISKSPLAEGEVLYRGIATAAFKQLVGGDKVEVGRVLSDPGFISTSRAMNIAMMSGGFGGVILKIQVGRGARGLDMSEHTRNPLEKEVVLGTETPMKVLGIRPPRGPGQPIIVRVGIGDLAKAYDPDQPRKPKGDPEGGQWVDESGGSAKQLTMAELEALEPDWSKVEPKMRAKMQDAVGGYTGSTYRDINAALRSGDPLSWAFGSQQIEIRRIDRAFEQAGHDLKRDALVFRGMARGTAFYELKVGDVFADRGFVSTSPDVRIARTFVGVQRGEEFKGKLFHIVVPKGTRVMSPAAPEEFGGSAEPELLLRRGTKFKVTGRKDNHIQVRVVP